MKKLIEHSLHFSPYAKAKKLAFHLWLNKNIKIKVTDRNSWGRKNKLTARQKQLKLKW